MEAPEGESNRDKSSSSSSPISVVSNFWKEFDLEEKKSEPDEKGLRIAENQENSQKNRPKLAESTRDFKEYQLRCQLRGHEDDVCGICVCGNVGIATSSRDRTVRLWSLDPSDERLYSESKILLGHTSFVGPLVWISPNEEYPDGGIVSGGMDTMALVWDLKTGEMVQTLRGHQLPVTGLTLDNGDIVSSSVDCTLRRWRKGQLVESWEAHKAPIQAVIKLPSGELVTGSSDTALKLWRGSTCTHTFVGHTDTVRGLAVMSGLGILSASHDGSIRLWALSGEVLMEMVGHTSIVYSVDSHASGLIVSSSKDCFTKIWKDGVCVQSIEHPGCVWDAKFLENGDIVTACCDGVVRIWTVKQDKIADSLEVELYFSQLTQQKISRKRVGGLKLEELPGLEALQIPDNPYDAADKWLLKENLPLSYQEQVVAFIQNTGQKDFILDPSFCDPYTGSSAYVPGQYSNKSASGNPTFKHIPKKGMLAFDMAQFDGILKKISVCNTEQEQDLKLSELESENGKMKVELEEFRTEATRIQLFELRAQSDEERATKQSEVNLLMDEVERAQTRLLSLEREKGLLRSKLDTANEDTENKNSDTSDSNSILENSLIAKEKIIAELNMELHNIETTLSNEREEHLNEIKKLNALLIEKEAALEEMKKELQGRPTTKLVDDLRKKVKILQAVGYNSIEAEDWEVATSGEEMSKMESLLLDKNRKMEHELTQLKVKLSEKASLLEKADSKTAELTVKVNEQQKLIQKLEDDILKGYSSKDKKGSLFDDWDLSEARSTEVSENADQKHVSSDQDQSSMLKVICNQRDRFRTRLRETEEEIRQLKERIGALTAELEKTKADNVKLYGKIRYVQDYSLEKVVSRGSKKPAEDLESGFSSDVESKYKKIYEDDINPFAAFSKKERDQRYKELGFRDRITLSSGRFLLGNKYARTFAFFYTIGLHILVFTCLYRMSALSYLSNGQEDVIIGDKQLNLPHAL